MLQAPRHSPCARCRSQVRSFPLAPASNSGDGVLDDNGPYRLNPQQLCRHQKRIRGGLSGKTLRMDHVAIDLYLEEVVQLGGLQDSRAILTRGDDGDFEPIAVKLMDESARFRRRAPRPCPL